MDDVRREHMLSIQHSLTLRDKSRIVVQYPDGHASSHEAARLCTLLERTSGMPPPIATVPSANLQKGVPDAQDGVRGELRYDAERGRLFVRCHDDWWYLPFDNDQ